MLLGLALYLPDTIMKPSLDDPFLPYYVISVFFVALFIGAILHLTSGQQQITSIKRLFVFIAALISFVVLWRGIAVYFYVAAHGGSVPPLGFERPGGNYLPYLVLLSFGLAVIAWLIYTNTKQANNSNNRIPMFQHFIVLCVYLGGCRVAWEIIDLLGKKVLTPH